MAERLRRLERLTAALGDAVTVDDVARVALTQIASVDGVVRAVLGIARGGGRELQYVPSDEEALSPLGVRWVSADAYDDNPLVRTVRTGRPSLLLDLDQVEETFPEITDLLRRTGAISLASIPLMVDEVCVGALMVSYRTDALREPEQQAFLGAFAAQVAQAVKRGLAYQVQHSTSEQLQRSLMPHSLPDLEGLALGSHYQPGGINVDVGGDWFDVLQLADGSVALTLGDVMGKGVPAAIVMSELRAATRAYALLDPDPSVVLDRLSTVVASLNAEEQVVTMLYGLIDPGRKAVDFAIAGHPPPLLVEPSGRPTVLGDQIGPALGIGIGAWPTTRVPLEDGTTVLFYSDGLVESRSQDLFVGIDRLRDQVAELAPRRRNPRELCARLSDLMGAGEAEDDVTLLAVTAASDQWRAALDLPADPRAAGAARHFVCTVLQEWNVVDEVIGTAELCVSELVTNAVIHAGTTSTVTVQADPEYVMVLVQDRGGRGAVRQPEQVDLTSVSGRGLSLVASLASAWSAEHSADGTTVWFELTRSGATSEAADQVLLDEDALLARFDGSDS